MDVRFGGGQGCAPPSAAACSCAAPASRPPGPAADAHRPSCRVPAALCRMAAAARLAGGSAGGCCRWAALLLRLAGACPGTPCGACADAACSCLLLLSTNGCGCCCCCWAALGYAGSGLTHACAGTPFRGALLQLSVPPMQRHVCRQRIGRAAAQQDADALLAVSAAGAADLNVQRAVAHPALRRGKAVERCAPVLCGRCAGPADGHACMAAGYGAQ